ncbi:MAG: 23S rRNA (guanosine(2251)-2'-O)-methyltransferase RlmB [Atopobiaceae bacterium]|jgi:23S rRNA (guanosine2251-2'-O)-methyltransferase|nr:23S rRNA (guanosine(2251)-2'-O)-methyltransferase RlmB [Atopobiaceae bacterium]
MPRPGSKRPSARDGAPNQKKGSRPTGKRPQKASGPRGRGTSSRAPSRSGLIEGRRAVAEALEAGIPLIRALVAEGEGGTAELAGRLAQAGVPVEPVPRARLDALSSHGAHQGVMVEARPFAYASLADVIAAAGAGPALVVVLDHVTDEGNFGAIVRSAEVVGAAGVIVANARAARVGVGAYKTSAGAVLHVPVAQVPNVAKAVRQLQEAGFWAGAATEHARQSAWAAPLDGRIALVMGSEGEGVSRIVREACDFECRLPQRGSIESLNVAQAATVLCYEWLRRTFPEVGGDGAHEE